AVRLRVERGHRGGDRDGYLAVDIGDARAAGRPRGEADGVGVDRGAEGAFADVGEAAALGDDDLALVAARDAEVDAVGDEPVVERIGRADVVVHGPALALDV